MDLKYKSLKGVKWGQKGCNCIILLRIKEKALSVNQFCSTDATQVNSMSVQVCFGEQIHSETKWSNSHRKIIIGLTSLLNILAKVKCNNRAEMFLNVLHSVYLRYKAGFCQIIIVSIGFEYVPWTFTDWKVGWQGGILERWWSL